MHKDDNTTDDAIAANDDLTIDTIEVDEIETTSEDGSTTVDHVHTHIHGHTHGHMHGEKEGCCGWACSDDKEGGCCSDDEDGCCGGGGCCSDEGGEWGCACCDDDDQEFDIDFTSDAVTKNFSAEEIARLQTMFGDLDLDAEEDDEDTEKELTEEDIALLQRLFWATKEGEQKSEE